jgi:hypothetical protein
MARPPILRQPASPLATGGRPRAAPANRPVRPGRPGLRSRSKLDTSARRLLREKFRLGLFDNPFVDADRADQLVGTSKVTDQTPRS